MMDIYSQIYSHHSLYQMIVIFLLLFHLVSSNLQTMIISSLGIRSCSAAQSLTVSSDSDCDKLLENGWKSITVNEGRCNSMTSDLFISNNPCLQSIVLKRNTLKYLNSFVISNNPQLSTLTIEDGTYYSLTNIESVCSFVNTVEISSIF